MPSGSRSPVRCYAAALLAGVQPGETIGAKDVEKARDWVSPGVARLVEYPLARDFFYGFVMVDLQREHATHVWFPEARSPTEAGWYVNQGNVDLGWFATAALIAAGR